MTQLNLLPDVKLDYLRTTRNKRLVIGIAVIVIMASVAILLLLGSIVYGFQKKNLSDLDKDIATYNKQLKDTQDLDKVLTIQNQLHSLTGLHEGKAVAARLPAYLAQITPTAASISQMQVDFEAKTISVTGTASGLEVVNTFADTFKFTKYQPLGQDGAPQGDPVNAFTKVVLSSFARNSSGANYTITTEFDPVIFNNASQIKLTVPNIISTRSLTEQPTDLFQSDASATNGGRN